MPGYIPSNGVVSSSGVAISGAGTVAVVPLLTDCSHPITNFGHQLLLPTQFAFGPGQGLPVLEASGSLAVSGAEMTNSYGLQLYAKDNIFNAKYNISIRAKPLGVSKIIFTLHYFSPTGGLELTLSNDVESNPGPPRR